VCCEKQREVEEEEALQGCSANNWYQSPKILGGGSSSVDFVRDGGRRRKEEAACGAMPLAPGYGVKPQGGGGGVMLPREDDGVMPS
jgi:hypothetical protein